MLVPGLHQPRFPCSEISSHWKPGFCRIGCPSVGRVCLFDLIFQLIFAVDRQTPAMEERSMVMLLSMGDFIQDLAFKFLGVQLSITAVKHLRLLQNTASLIFGPFPARSVDGGTLMQVTCCYAVFSPYILVSKNDFDIYSILCQSHSSHDLMCNILLICLSLAVREESRIKPRKW